MPLSDARRFILEIDQKESLRQALSLARSRVEMFETLRAAHFDFTPQEFDEAYQGLDSRCQTWEQADIYKNIKEWWEYLTRFQQ